MLQVHTRDPTNIILQSQTYFACQAYYLLQKHFRETCNASRVGGLSARRMNTIHNAIWTPQTIFKRFYENYGLEILLLHLIVKFISCYYNNFSKKT